MGIQLNRKKNVVILAISDDFIIDNIEEFNLSINSLLSGNKTYIALDMSCVEFVSSRGLGAIGKAMDITRKNGGDLKIFGMRQEVKKLFDICGLSKIIDIFDNEEDAVLSCGDSVSDIEKRLLWSVKPKD